MQVFQRNATRSPGSFGFVESLFFLDIKVKCFEVHTRRAVEFIVESDSMSDDFYRGSIPNIGQMLSNRTRVLKDQKLCVHRH